MPVQTSGEPETEVQRAGIFVEQKSLKRKKVLIVDDDEDAARFLSLRLSNLGFEVACVYDGNNGLHHAICHIPDLIILDLYLPKLSGEEICKAIREHNDEKITAIPIIMLSAKDKVVDKIVGKVLGANAYVTKPFEFEDLLREIKMLNLLA
jgi:DNA-binding response OmpR family regulator